MSNERHFTTRRGFVGAMGFGALGLYATWAAYGASPLPFGLGDGPADPHAGSGAPSAHASHGETAPAAAHEGGGTLTPAEFERRHAAFLKRFRQADGSIRPVATPAIAEAGHGASDGSAHGGHAMAAPAAPDAHAGHTAPVVSDPHAGHSMSAPAAARDPHAGHTMPAAAAPDPHAGHGAPAPVAAHGHGDAPTAVAPTTLAEHPAGGAEPIEVYLVAGRFAFEPDDLRLQVGQAYRFHMMATDVAHGASIALGRASRIVRLRPDTVTTLDLTFGAAGKHLVYCTVYCGPGHDSMHGLITVA